MKILSIVIGSCKTSLGDEQQCPKSKRYAVWQETTLGQRFEVDVILHCDLQSAGNGDDLEATTDYSRVYEYVP